MSGQMWAQYMDRASDTDSGGARCTRRADPALAKNHFAGGAE